MNGGERYRERADHQGRPPGAWSATARRWKLGGVMAIVALLGSVGACESSTPATPVAQSAGARAAANAANAAPKASLDLVALHRSGQLRQLPVVVAETPHDALHGAPSRYEGYELATILRLIPAYATLEWSTSSVRFHQADGDSTTVNHDQLTDGHGVLAVRDIDAPRGERWRTYRRGQFDMTPGPFYLVWDGEPAKEGRPWVAQIERITIEELRPTDSPAFPRHAPEARPGFRLFRDLCFSCHGVNLAGGRVGPELNVPRNVTEYFAMADLRTYVRSPRSIRATATMPDFAQLTPPELDAIIAYLVAMRGAKVCATRDDCARFPRP